jgi:hypothetical protein
MLACRACRVPIAAATGCAICDPVRQNLVVVGENEDEQPSLSGTSALGVKLLRARLVQLEKELKANPLSKDAEKRLLACTNAVAKLLETGRKLIQDGVSAMEAISFREQAELFVGWYANLSPPYRADVLSKFTAFEQEISRPLAEADN